MKTTAMSSTSHPIRALLGVGWFWALAGFVLVGGAVAFHIGLVTQEAVVLGTIGLLVGSGVGVVMVSFAERTSLEGGLVPFGALGLTGGLVVIALTQSPAPLGLVLVCTGWAGAAGAAYGLPLARLVRINGTALLWRAGYMTNIAGAACGGALAYWLISSGTPMVSVLTIVAGVNLAVALYVAYRQPDAWLRLLVACLVRLCYRLDVQGNGHIPAAGPALLVCNHVSFIDAPIIAAATRRPVRFVMDHRLYRTPGLNMLYRLAGVVPIAAAKDDPEVLAAAYERIAEYLSAGELVCIFPEGRITHNGELSQFRSGVERIIGRTPVPVVPLALRGLWGSFFSRANGVAMSGWPKRLWSRVSVVADRPVAGGAADAAKLQAKVGKLRGQVC